MIKKEFYNKITSVLNEALFHVRNTLIERDHFDITEFNITNLYGFIFNRGWAKL